MEPDINQSSFDQLYVNKMWHILENFENLEKLGNFTQQPWKVREFCRRNLQFLPPAEFHCFLPLLRGPSTKIRTSAIKSWNLRGSSAWREFSWEIVPKIHWKVRGFWSSRKSATVTFASTEGARSLIVTKRKIVKTSNLNFCFTRSSYLDCLCDVFKIYGMIHKSRFTSNSHPSHNRDHRRGHHPSNF